MGNFDQFRRVFVNFDDSLNTSSDVHESALESVLEDVYAGEFIISTEEYAELIRTSTLLEVIIDFNKNSPGYNLVDVIKCVERLTRVTSDEKPEN